MYKLLMLIVVLVWGCSPKKNTDRAASDSTLSQAASIPVAPADTVAANAKPMDDGPAMPDNTDAEQKPRQVDDETATSPVYGILSPNCRNRDDQASEGDDFVRQCPGYGGYSLWALGFDGLPNYRIETDTPNDDFVAPLLPLETGQAAGYVRADQFVQQLDDQLEWRLDPATGKPYAVIVRAVFYKNTGDAKRSVRSGNKAAEFLLVRGLAGYQAMQYDLPTTDTPYNPVEQARMLAAKALEKAR